MADETVNVRYMGDDVEAAVDFYTKHFGFTVHSSPQPLRTSCGVGCVCC